MEEKSNEIDLIELSRNIMVRLYHFTLRRYKLLGIFISIGFFIGIVLYFMNKEQYENKIKATSFVISPQIIVDIVNSLGDINSNDKELASRILKLDIKEIQNFSSIEADTIQSIVGFPKMLEVRIKFKRSFDMDRFSQKLTAYIDSSQFVKNELFLEKQRALAMAKKYDEEINNLDSLQKNILSSSLETAKSSQSNLLVLNDKINNFFHNDILTLQEKRQSELNRLERMTGFYIIDQQAGLKAKEVSIVKMTFKYAAIFFGLGFFITILLEFIRQVKNIERRRKLVDSVD